MTLIALIRHGETDWNRAGRIQGHTDIGLNDAGRMQAAAAAAALRGGEFMRLVSSPLIRAKETADIIGQALGLGDPELFDGLKERRYGDAEGMDILPFRTAYAPGAVIPGAETDAEVLDRALGCLAAIAAQGEPVIAVSHGGLIGRVLRDASGDAYPRAGEHIGNGSQQVIDVTDSGVRVLAYSGSPR